jgi:hypothetical protein
MTTSPMLKITRYLVTGRRYVKRRFFSHFCRTGFSAFDELKLNATKLVFAVADPFAGLWLHLSRPLSPVGYNVFVTFGICKCHCAFDNPRRPIGARAVFRVAVSFLPCLCRANGNRRLPWRKEAIPVQSRKI